MKIISLFNVLRKLYLKVDSEEAPLELCSCNVITSAYTSTIYDLNRKEQKSTKMRPQTETHLLHMRCPKFN